MAPYKAKDNQMEFWVTNISNLRVSLADLDLTIKPYTSVNLLDKKHFKYTVEQLELSFKSGSLFKKSDKIVKRLNAPRPNINKIEISEQYLKREDRSLFSIKEQKYEELTISDEQFAEDNADLADQNPEIIPTTVGKK
jgi:hypothetical protein